MYASMFVCLYYMATRHIFYAAIFAAIQRDNKKCTQQDYVANRYSCIAIAIFMQKAKFYCVYVPHLLNKGMTYLAAVLITNDGSPLKEKNYYWHSLLIQVPRQSLYKQFS